MDSEIACDICCALIRPECQQSHADWHITLTNQRTAERHGEHA